MTDEYNEQEISKFVFDMFNKKQEKDFSSFRSNLLTDKDVEELEISEEKIIEFKTFLNKKFNEFFKHCKNQGKTKEKKQKEKKEKEKEKKQICEFVIGSGKNKGNQCSKLSKENSQYCGLHLKKKIVEDIETDPRSDNEIENEIIEFDD